MPQMSIGRGARHARARRERRPQAESLDDEEEVESVLTSAGSLPINHPAHGLAEPRLCGCTQSKVRHEIHRARRRESLAGTPARPTTARRPTRYRAERPHQTIRVLSKYSSTVPPGSPPASILRGAPERTGAGEHCRCPPTVSGTAPRSPRRTAGPIT